MITKKILIVEDDYLQAFVQMKFLQNKGYEVTMAATGTQALEIASKNKFDVIIMDIRIKGEMDGIDVMNEIRKFSSIPVIFCTGNSESTIRERIKMSNVKAFMIKPVDLEELEKMVRSI